MKTMKTYKLANKSLLKIGDMVKDIRNKTHIITEIKNGGAVHEYISSKKYWLSNATLFTTDSNKWL